MISKENKSKSPLSETLIKLMEKRARQAPYKMNLLSDVRFKPRQGTMYCERAKSSKTSGRSICADCHEIYKVPEDKCRVCGSDNVKRIGPIARLPRKNAHKKKWEEFFNHCGKTCAKGCR